MRNAVLSSICAAAIGLSAIGGAFAQTSGTTSTGAPATNQTNVTGPAATTGNDAGMHAMNKMKKKTKSHMKKSDMEKKM